MTAQKLKVVQMARRDMKMTANECARKSSRQWDERRAQKRRFDGDGKFADEEVRNTKTRDGGGSPSLKCLRLGGGESRAEMRRKVSGSWWRRARRVVVVTPKMVRAEAGATESLREMK